MKRKQLWFVIPALMLCINGHLLGYSDGEGSDWFPYQISSIGDWQELMATPDNWGDYFVLTNDIDLTGIPVTPVGNSDRAFYGVFDGAGHRIANAVIHQPGDNYVGLFGRISSYGTISNLGVDNITVTGNDYVGGLAGYTYDGIITGCYATGTVNGYSLVGGLVGYSNFGRLSACYAKADVAGDSTVGGLVGGDYDSSIADCFAAGQVSGYMEIGGLAGWSWKASHTTAACFWDIDTSGTNYGVGNVDPDPAGVMGKTTAEMKIDSTFTDAGWDFDENDGDAADWKMLPNDYPHLQWEVFSNINGQGTEISPYLISSVDDFLQFANKANAATYWAGGVYTRLECHLDLQGIALMPIGGTYDDGEGNLEALFFEGNFDGNGYRISNATVGQAGQSNIGLFGQVGSQGGISRLGVENISATGEYGVGGLVGNNNGGTISFCSTTGQVYGYNQAGGIAGYSNSGTITACYSRCSVSGDRYIGGLAGLSFSNSITDSYSVGSVMGSYSTGGLFGYENGSTVSSCFWDIETSGQLNSPAGAGKTTEEMMTLSTFTTAGWDFTNTWIIPCNAYPRLNSERRYSGGTGTQADPFQISRTNDWQTITAIPNDWDKHFILTADLDFTGVNALTPVAPDTIASTDYQFEGTRFTGSLNGQGHTLHNAVIYQPDHDFVGLFGSIGVEGRVENLNLENISVTGRLSVGALAGENYTGTIVHCRTHGTVNGSYWHCGGLVGDGNGGSISKCSAKGTVNGTNWVGGLVGYHHNNGTINACSAAAEVNGTSIVGGLAGIEEDWNSYISESYATGTVTATTTQAGGLVGRLQSGFIQQSYSTGDVFCPSNAGALLGYNTPGSGYVSDLFWDTETCHLTVGVGGGNSSGVTGKTTAQMKTLSTFPWDFDTVWSICEQTNYPRLQWQIPLGDFTCPDGISVEDLQYFAAQWLTDDCSAFNQCQGTDLDNSDNVDLADFVVFANQWMKEI